MLNYDSSRTPIFRRADLFAAIVVVQVVAGTALACSDQPPLIGGQGGVRRAGLTLSDTVVLAETDSIYIGRPGPMFAVGPGGDFFVPDQFSDRVVRFGRSGRFKQAYGRRGRGPGEMTGVGLATVVIDSLLVQTTMGRMIHAFRLSDGQAIGRAGHRGFTGWGQARGDSIVFGNFDPYSRRGVLVLPMRRLFDPDSAPLGSTIAPFPSEYQRFPGLDIFNSVAVASWNDTILVGFTASQTLVRYMLDGHVIDSLYVPQRSRRGWDPKRSKVLRVAAPEQFRDRLRSISALYGLWRLDDGRMVIWHSDADAHQPNPRLPPQITGVAYISVVTADLARACVDLRVPDFDSGTPRLTVVGDSVFALDQVVPADPAGRPHTVIRVYRIETANCEWLPTTPT